MTTRARSAAVKRATRETAIAVDWKLDGSGQGNVKTGIPFLDHMLSLLAKHGLFDLTVRAKGDLEIDVHHTNEDVGIALGQAFAKAVGDKAGIARFGWAYVPMEEALARAVVDLSGRPLLKITYPEADNASLQLASGGNYTLHDAEHFLESFVRESRITLHVTVLAGKDFHHTWEAVFKALGRALDSATQLDRRVRGIPSTKGRL